MIMHLLVFFVYIFNLWIACTVMIKLRVTIIDHNIQCTDTINNLDYAHYAHT